MPRLHRSRERPVCALLPHSHRRRGRAGSGDDRGVAADGTLHPVQEAFLDEGAFQCGYCTAGMIMGVAGVLRTNPEGVGEGSSFGIAKAHLPLQRLRQVPEGRPRGSGANRKGERMKTEPHAKGLPQPDYDKLDYNEPIERMGYDFGLSRRSFVKVLGAGLLITVSLPTLAQESGRRGRGGFFGGGARTIGARVRSGHGRNHHGAVGQGRGRAGRADGIVAGRRRRASRAGQPGTNAAGRQTCVVPDDGITAGSMTTPRTVPPVRHGAAAARELLIEFACQQWKVKRTAVEMHDGKVVDAADKRSLTYADLAKATRPQSWPRLEAAAARLIRRLSLQTGIPLPNGLDSDASRAAMVLRCDHAGEAVQSVHEDESYQLDVSPQRAQLAAPTPVGVLRGMETFLQLVEHDAQGFSAPSVHIVDRCCPSWKIWYC